MEDNLTTEDKDRNIAVLIRNKDLPFSEASRGVKEETIRSIPDLYGSPYRLLPTKKGGWQIYERKGFVLPCFLEEQRKEPSDGFCAVYAYKGEEKPRTLFLGNTGNTETIDFVVNELSKNVLEQRRWFAWPPRGLTTENGRDYGLTCGLITAVGIVGLMAFDLGLAAYSHSHVSGNLVYKGVINSLSKLGLTFGALVIVGQFIPQAILFSRLGKVVDRRRVKNLPEEAFSFLYGQEAEEAIREEQTIMTEELRKTGLYELLKREGVQIPKPQFAAIYDVLKTTEIEKIRELQERLAQEPQPTRVPLETVVKVFSSA